MFNDILVFIIALALVMKGAALTTKYAGKFAESFRLSKYTVGFIVVAIISILPETLIGINSAMADVPAFGLATLFGSNVADLTLIFGIVVILAGRGLKVESKVLKNNQVYPFLLLLPLVLGLDGYFSRVEGLALILVGAVFYFLAFRKGGDVKAKAPAHGDRAKNLIWLLLGMAALLFGTYLTVHAATSLATDLGISSLLIGIVVVGLGTTMPELFFSVRALRNHDDSLAVGDVLGTVLADATVVVGILALVRPFSFPNQIIYVSGIFMVTAAIILFRFMKTGRQLSRRESLMLIAFWIGFVILEILINS